MLRALTRKRRLISRRLDALRDDTRGISAVEFAFVLPVMLTLFFGTVETTQALYSARKIANTVRIVGDLASRSTAMSSSTGSSIMGAAAAVVAPFSAGNAKLVVSGITISTTGTATVSWSLGRNMSPRSCSSAVTVPAGLKPPIGTAGFIVLTEGSMVYTPTVGYVMTGSFTSTESIYMAPRSGSAITFSGGSACVTV